MPTPRKQRERAKAEKPSCKCGRVCEYYGLVGGFSVACRQCNEKNAKRQRDGRAKRKAVETVTKRKERGK